MADEPKPTRIVEFLPSTEGSLSAIASGNAPIVYFDEVANFGTYSGIAHITLLAMRFLPAPDGQSGRDCVVAAHLRMNYVALKMLKDVTEQMIAQLESAPPDASIN